MSSCQDRMLQMLRQGSFFCFGGAVEDYLVTELEVVNAKTNQEGEGRPLLIRIKHTERAIRPELSGFGGHRRGDACAPNRGGNEPIVMQRAYSTANVRQKQRDRLVKCCCSSGFGYLNSLRKDPNTTRRKFLHAPLPSAIAQKSRKH